VRALLLTLLLLPMAAAAQTTHLVRALDFFFLPDTVVMLAGDSVRFQTQQLHNMMEVAAQDWAQDLAIHNGGFRTVIGRDTTFAIDTAGTYYFVCEPHGFMGMKGVLLVAPGGTTTVGGVAPSHVHAWPNPARETLHVRLDTGPATIALRTVTGEQLMHCGPLPLGLAHLAVDRLPAGSYLLEVTDRNGIARGRIQVQH